MLIEVEQFENQIGDPEYERNYRALAAEIIKLAVDDYRHSLKHRYANVREELEDFFLSDYFERINPMGDMSGYDMICLIQDQEKNINTYSYTSVKKPWGVDRRRKEYRSVKNIG
ncbi:MAG: hypothetical protein ATN35_12750 [Epulopiscium sp. Nele67-Bin004]|nr:MAG: hypothetical protein ATN35_12750 [Epulopiscium sp. Nele67-Bin004]